MGHIYQDENNGLAQTMRHRKHHNHRRLMFWAAENRSHAMNKVTIKIQTGTPSADADRMIKLVADTLPDREIEIVYCDDPAMNVKLVHLPAGHTLKPCSAVLKISDDVKSSGGEFDPYEKPMGGRYRRD